MKSSSSSDLLKFMLIPTKFRLSPKKGSVEKSWGRFLNEAYLRRTYLQGRMHVLAGKVASTSVENAVHCKDGCSALQEGLQCTASEMGKTGTEIASLILDRRKGREKGLHMEAL